MFHTVSKLVKMNILNMVILIFLTLNIQTTCTCKTLETFVVCSLFWWNLKALLFALLWGKMTEKKQRKENERKLKEHIIQNFSLFFFSLYHRENARKYYLVLLPHMRVWKKSGDCWSKHNQKYNVLAIYIVHFFLDI